MTFDDFQKRVRRELAQKPNLGSWSVHFAKIGSKREWLVIVLAGSSFASVVVPKTFARATIASDVVQQIARMIATQHGADAVQQARGRSPPVRGIA